VWNNFDREKLADLTPQNFKAFKTECQKMMKDWDKRYMKHMKGANVKLGEITREVAVPLTNLFESNYHFHNINVMVKKNIFVPDFRYKALEDKFVMHSTRLFELFRDFGELKDPFDIQQ
jgi:hypothetical protein